jgi:SAM-dependent methyltransferase
MTQLHERNTFGLDTVGRFTDRAVDYVRYRPGYPGEAVHAMLAGLGSPEHLVAADVGAGTGISARLLGDQGVRVLAIEPGAAMRGSAAPHSRVTWVGGMAEATGLRSHAVDLVVCAQAFHWFRAADALSEFARILKPQGRLAIVWNRRSARDPLTAGYREAIAEVSAEIISESMPFEPGVVAQSGLFSPVTRTTYANAQRLDLDGLIGRARSASYVPKTDAATERLGALLRTLHQRHADAGGFVRLIYETEVFCANCL